ncbi:transposase-like zinc-binding domain-containing protein [Actinomyces sp. Z16]|uniref:transposase-like zinc-binding domain-containing protein n=1 Tax=Actinomyces sp. Z16 TaxID=2079536 RepID=UPI003FA37CA0
MAWEVNPGRWLTFGVDVRAVRTRSPRARLCPICQTPMKKPGRTAAGTQRWKCTAPVGPPTPRLDRPRPVGPPTPRWTAVTGGYGGPTGEQRSNRGTAVQPGNSGPTDRLNSHAHRHPTAHRHPSTDTTGPSEPGGARTTHTFAPTTPKKASGNAKAGPAEPARTPRHAGLKQHVRAYNPSLPGKKMRYGRRWGPCPSRKADMPKSARTREWPGS